MADTMDLVQDRAEEQRIRALSERQAQRQAAAPGVAPSGARACTYCGDQIAPARLAAMPYTNRCTECASRAELAARSLGG
jgi:RNA polymerase-binding transcription factor DksA